MVVSRSCRQFGNFQKNNALGDFYGTILLQSVPEHAEKLFEIGIFTFC